MSQRLAHSQKLWFDTGTARGYKGTLAPTRTHKPKDGQTKAQEGYRKMTIPQIYAKLAELEQGIIRKQRLYTDLTKSEKTPMTLKTRAGAKAEALGMVLGDVTILMDRIIEDGEQDV